MVIPTLNAGPGFEDLLEGISAQRGGFNVEVVVVDSGSEDGTPELAKRHGVSVHCIPPSEFDHGATRNLGVSLSRGEYVALTVQDALPLDENWLEAMVESLERDDQVAGVYGRQVPHPGAGTLARALTNNLATASPERREQYIESEESYRRAPAVEKRRVVAFDDVSSCIRRSVWEELPFERTSFGEDLRWGKAVVEAGYRLVYEPRSAVFHSHERGALYELRRHYVDAAILSELFGEGPVVDLRRLIPGIPFATAHHYRMLRREAKGENVPWTSAVAVRQAALSRLGAYLGGRSESIARTSPRLHELLSKGI